MRPGLHIIGIILGFLVLSPSASVKLCGGGISLVHELFNSLLDQYSQSLHHMDDERVWGYYSDVEPQSVFSRLDSPNAPPMLFAAFDEEMRNDLQETENTISFPVFYVPYVAAVNMPGVCADDHRSCDLRLPQRILMDIFHGNISYWNHGEIVQYNPGIKLPKKKILLISRRLEHNGDSVGRFCFLDVVGKHVCLEPPAVDMAALVHAAPFSIAKVAPAQAVSFGLQVVELVKRGATLNPTLSAVEAFVQDPQDTHAYPLVKRIHLAVSRKLVNANNSTENMCPVAAELKRFLVWILTSGEAGKTLGESSTVLVPIGEIRRTLMTKLGVMECLVQEDGAMLVDHYIQKTTRTSGADVTDADLMTIISVSGGCVGLLILILVAILIRYCLIRLSDIRNDVWKITEFDIVPPESERMDSFVGSAVHFASQPPHGGAMSVVEDRFKRRRNDGKRVSAIYKSVSVSLEPTLIPMSTVFDYPTRKTLVELRKLSHDNLQRFYGLAVFSENLDSSLFQMDEIGVDRITLTPPPSERNASARPSFSQSIFYAVTDQCDGDSIFDWLHFSPMAHTEDSKFAVLVSLVSGLDYLHGKGIVHGKLNSQCCYFDHNYSVKIADWQCLDKLQAYRRLHPSDIYVPSPLADCLRGGGCCLQRKNDTKRRIINQTFLLRWRPPECLRNDVPLARRRLLEDEHRGQRAPDDLKALSQDDFEGIDGTVKYPQLEITLSRSHDPSSDVYSLGVIMNECWTFAIPFSHVDSRYEHEIDLLEAVSQGDLVLDVDSETPELIEGLIVSCTRSPSEGRPSISAIKKSTAHLSDQHKSGLEIYLELLDSQIREAEKKIVHLDEEEELLGSIDEAILREYLPKNIAEKVLATRENLGWGQENSNHVVPAKQFRTTTVCAVRLINFYCATQDLPANEIISELNRLNRLMTEIVEGSGAICITSLGTTMMLAVDFEACRGDADRQAEIMADCALELQVCLRCYGKVPRTVAQTEFAIALDTGTVATGLLAGNVPSYCMLGGVMENVRELLKFSAPKFISLSHATNQLLVDSAKFETSLHMTHENFGDIFRLQGRMKSQL